MLLTSQDGVPLADAVLTFYARNHIAWWLRKNVRREASEDDDSSDKLVRPIN